MTTKVCTKCGHEKAVDQFRICKGRPDSWCKVCVGASAIRNVKERMRDPEFRKQFIEKVRIRRLKRVFNLTPEKYDALLRMQHGKCKCGKTPEQIGKRLCIDHDHRTGKIRGLLCDQCNTALGLLNDDPILLRLYATYLENENET